MKTLIQRTRDLRRWAIATTLSLALLWGYTAPAMAIGSSPSDPSEGLVQLDKVEQRSKDVLKNGPRGMDEVQSRSEGGLNGVQGAANRSEMNNPENSQDAETVMDGIKDALNSLRD